MTDKEETKVEATVVAKEETKEEIKPNTTLFVSGVSKTVKEEDVQAKFATYGTINSVRFKGNYAFVDFDSTASA